ncbi:MAG: hypothetical protein A2283_24320 [Lentisphaerae bacterium RIFOXYA12_FULL_48_11]|nr:MAG: hypothetical protein A2283_24320 [Lentisphaerae bacterium RIFOXYA12_FULL_48_11]
MHHYRTAIIQLPLVKDTPTVAVKTPAQVAEICSDMVDLAQEVFQVLVLSSKNKLITRCMVSIGLLDASLVHPREVFRQAIIEHGAAIALCHNHPSGDSTASAEDIRITKQLIECGNILDIKILDHVIIGKKTETQPGFLSMRESGLCDFSGK